MYVRVCLFVIYDNFESLGLKVHFATQLRISKVQVEFICQGHRVKVKVTVGKCKVQ